MAALISAVHQGFPGLVNLLYLSEFKHSVILCYSVYRHTPVILPVFSIRVIVLVFASLRINKKHGALCLNMIFFQPGGRN